MQSFQDDIYNLKAYETNKSTLIRLENTQIQIQSQIQNLENLQKKLEENEDNKAVLSEKINDLSSKRNTLEDEIKTLKIENIVHEIERNCRNVQRTGHKDLSYGEYRYLWRKHQRNARDY